MSSQFTYSIARELLYGSINGKKFVIAAYSGGGRGSTNPKVRENSFNSYFASKPTISHAHGKRGGAVPPGNWTIMPPQNHVHHLGYYVSKLVPDEATEKRYPQRRYKFPEGFYIHGPGIQGSDGCLIIERIHRLPLLRAIGEAGGASLTVLWDGEYMEQRLENSSRTSSTA
jgi:hypothetical protein